MDMKMERNCLMQKLAIKTIHLCNSEQPVTAESDEPNNSDVSYSLRLCCFSLTP